MIGRLFILPALGLSCAANAQVSPMPGPDDTRIQSILFDPAARVRLVAFPQTPLTVILLPEDPIQRANISDANAFQVTVIGRSDSLSIVPVRTGASARLTVDTQRRHYEFELETGASLSAAYLVRFSDHPTASLPAASVPVAKPATVAARYRLSGDKVIRPVELFDDGERTYLRWTPDQSLPAIFGIGASGAEEAVNGHIPSSATAMTHSVAAKLPPSILANQLLAADKTGAGAGSKRVVARVNWAPAATLAQLGAYRFAGQAGRTHRCFHECSAAHHLG